MGVIAKPRRGVRRSPGAARYARRGNVEPLLAAKPGLYFRYDVAVIELVAQRLHLFVQ